MPPSRQDIADFNSNRPFDVDEWRRNHNFSVEEDKFADVPELDYSHFHSEPDAKSKIYPFVGLGACILSAVFVILAVRELVIIEWPSIVSLVGRIF